MNRRPRIVVIGAGVAGITTAYVLRRSGFDDITVFEKGSDVGGVWHWNRYPGWPATYPRSCASSASPRSPTGPTSGPAVVISSGTTAMWSNGSG